MESFSPTTGGDLRHTTSPPSRQALPSSLTAPPRPLEGLQLLGPVSRQDFLGEAPALLGHPSCPEGSVCLLLVGNVSDVLPPMDLASAEWFGRPLTEVQQNETFTRSSSKVTL